MNKKAHTLGSRSAFDCEGGAQPGATGVALLALFWRVGEHGLGHLGGFAGLGSRHKQIRALHFDCAGDAALQPVLNALYSAVGLVVAKRFGYLRGPTEVGNKSAVFVHDQHHKPLVYRGQQHDLSG